MTGWYGINRVFTCYVLWNGWKPLLDSGGVGIHGLPSSANFTKYSTSLSLRDVPGTSSCTVLEYNNTYQVQLGNGTPPTTLTIPSPNPAIGRNYILLTFYEYDGSSSSPLPNMNLPWIIHFCICYKSSASWCSMSDLRPNGGLKRCGFISSSLSSY